MNRILIVMLLLAARQSFAQQKKPLIPGQPFPYKGTFFVGGEVNQERTFDSYKGKYLLLDLFGSNCIQCFQNMPKMDSFRSRYREQLNILLIGSIDKYLPELCRKFKERFNLKLDIALDSLLFPTIKYYFLPTYVWIGPDGIIKAVTAPDKVNSKNIETFISGKPLPFGELQREQPFERRKEFLIGGNGGADTNYLVRSILSRWNPTLPYISHAKMQFDQDNRNFHAFGANMEGLYRLAFFGTHFWKYGDSLNGKAWLHPVLIDGSEPDEESKFCYSASYRSSAPPDLSRLLKSTLEQYFGYKGRVVRKSMPYFSVTIIPSLLDSIRTKGEKSFKRYTHASMLFKNVPLDFVISRIDYYNRSGVPFIDESSFNGNVDLNIEAILTVEDDFFSALRKVGILIEKKQRIMDVLELTKSE